MCKKRFICTFRLYFSPRNVHFKRYLNISIFLLRPLRVQLLLAAAAHRSDSETAILFPAGFANLISPSVPRYGGSCIFLIWVDSGL